MNKIAHKINPLFYNLCKRSLAWWEGLLNLQVNIRWCSYYRWWDQKPQKRKSNSTYNSVSLGGNWQGGIGTGGNISRGKNLVKKGWGGLAIYRGGMTGGKCPGEMSGGEIVIAPGNNNTSKSLPGNKYDNSTYPSHLEVPVWHTVSYRSGGGVETWYWHFDDRGRGWLERSGNAYTIIYYTTKYMWNVFGMDKSIFVYKEFYIFQCLKNPHLLCRMLNMIPRSY